MLFIAAVSVLLPLATLFTPCTATPIEPSIKGATTSKFYKGHDIPSLKLLYDGGYKYKDTARNNATRPLEDILGDGGMNAVRIRIWVNPSDGVYGLQYNLDMASWFSAKGYAIYLDFHFSDTWADPHKQYIPAAWPQNDLTQLSTTLRGYVSSTLVSFADAKIPLSIVALGNEIHNGMLWPLGEADPSISDYSSRVANFTQLATLWAAARAGITDAANSGVAKPTVMVHIDNGWDLQLQQNWFGALTGTGKVSTVDWDVFGFSFYPFYGTNATLANLKNTLDTLAWSYGKPLHVVETDWPESCPAVGTLDGGGLSDDSVPVSAAGQTEWVDDIVGVVKGVANGLGAGVWYWEPGWLNNTGLGSNCSDAILFEGDYSDYPTSVVGYSRSSVNMYAGV